jgi:phage terminase small subunit
MKNSSKPLPEPPAHLSQAAADLWRELVAKVVANPAKRAMFLSALESLDRAEQARRVVAAEGLIQNGVKMQHAHPMLRVEAENRKTFARAWRDLGLIQRPAPNNESVWTFR